MCFPPPDHKRPGIHPPAQPQDQPHPDRRGHHLPGPGPRPRHRALPGLVGAAGAAGDVRRGARGPHGRADRQPGLLHDRRGGRGGRRPGPGRQSDTAGRQFNEKILGLTNQLSMAQDSLHKESVQECMQGPVKAIPS